MNPARYLKLWLQKKRSYEAPLNQMSKAEYERRNPYSDARVQHFLDTLQRATDIHPTLLADISPPVDKNNAEEEGKETARIVTNFIFRYAAENNLGAKGESPARIGLGQLRQAASQWAEENLKGK